VWRRWYHVLVETPDGKRHLIAVEATSAREARQLVGADWGEDNVREVTSPR
jgi:hypothetical protein